MSVFFPLLIGLLGFITGIFINFVIEFLYAKRNFIPGDELAVKTNKGILVYFFPWKFPEIALPKKIRIIAIDILFIIISLWLWVSPPTKVEFFWGFPLLIYFSIIIVIDMEYKLIFNQMSIVGAILGITLGVYLHGFTQTLFGGLFGYGIMFIMYKLGEIYIKRLAISRGEEVEEVALGFGDVNLGGILGLILGWPGIMIGLFFGVFLGGIFSLGIIIFKKITGRYSALEAIPYAPFLIIGTIVLIYFRSWVS
ncbi:MAG: hypothetical protein HON98_08230 [Chloroflexi bacterium]|jgi:prepilin signal peptidase PulO-like enzyme (type II secretory pathway)|nr:hypothetical protein [Chloroflexota bacterium]MBT3669932.1 hypothetical protein [Chloroflexota bacterium]MBT4001867.1 hypothetical protein [Chloroflexota bacterium]MBT4304834.1 hypothetical protein [Chloroflexota bacterium]MBT4534665.1 hypothetical protein [Chloroflexota bacterium]